MILRFGSCARWLAFFLLCAAGPVEAQESVTGIDPAKRAELQAEINQAMDRIRAIVNQPVSVAARQPGMQVRVFSPGWFHDGASRPDFNHADVRATQEHVYDALGYVTSDLNPGVVFVGSQLEFNPQLKFFYTDRSLPKKKLSEEEMLEINRLFRVIGGCEQQLNMVLIRSPARPTEFANSPPIVTNETIIITTTNTTEEWVRVPIPRSRIINCGLGIFALLLFYAVYKLFTR